jgi:GcrA cell cycle regulator
MTWTMEQIAILKRMNGAGEPYRAIAAALGPDFTRSAVCGKIHRLNISNRTNGTNSRPPRKRVRKGQSEPKAPHTSPDPLPPPPPAPLGARMLSVLELTDAVCKFPIGDPDKPAFGFCGCPRQDEGPYCGFHARIAFLPTPKKERRNRFAAYVADGFRRAA